MCIKQAQQLFIILLIQNYEILQIFLGKSKNFIKL